MQNYRKIWESCFGAAPIDEFGRPFDIHHLDGNRNNNEISNLKAVSIREHYNIHYNQGDWGACVMIKKRLNLSKEEVELIVQKRSESRKGTTQSDETKEKIRSTLTGRKRGPLSEEWKAKISQANQGKKRNNGRTGSRHSEEAKKKIGEANSKALKGRKLSEEGRLKRIGRVSWNKGGTSSEETKKRISESKKGKPWTEARRLAQKNKNK